MRGRIADEIPVFGICLGAQRLTDAPGATIHTLTQPETGWTRVDYSDGSALDALQWHDDKPATRRALTGP